MAEWARVLRLEAAAEIRRLDALLNGRIKARQGTRQYDLLSFWLFHGP